MTRPDVGMSTGGPSMRRIASAFGQQVVFRGFGMIASVVMLALTVRHLGAGSYGHLTTAIMFVSLWTSLTELGIGAVIVRRVTGAGADLSHLVRLNTGLSLIYCVPLTLLAIGSGIAIYAAQGTPEVVQIIPIIAVSLTLTTISSCLLPVFLTTVRFTAVAWSDFAGRVVSLGLTVVLVQADAGIAAFAVVQLVPPLLVLLIQGVAASRILSWRPIFHLAESWDLVRESLPQTGVLIIGVLYWRVDGVILSLLSTATETGIYYVAYTFAFTLTMITQFFGASTLSSMTRLYSEDSGAFAAFTQRATQTMLFFGAPIAVVGAVLSGSFIAAIGSSELSDRGGPVLTLLFVAVGITFLNTVASQALFASHQQNFLLKLNVVNLLLNIALNIVLIPFYGAVGAGIALVASELIGLVVTTIRLRRLSSYRSPWGFAAHLLVPLGAAGATAELIHDGPRDLVPAFVAAAVVYLAVNAAIGPVRVSTIRELLRPDAAREGA